MLKRIYLYLLIIGGVFISVAVVIAADVDIVISEIMINALDDSTGEWVEIYNRGNTPVDLTDWILQDNNSSDTIVTSMCPNNNCTIPARECWLIAETSVDLQNEFNNYTPSLAVDITRSIFLGPASAIGGGLANSNDRLVLSNSTPAVVDCYSWDNTNTCNSPPLTYIAGGNGSHFQADGSNGQSAANIQGTWYDHVTNASPYNCTNIASGGYPTAVSLQTISAASQHTGLILTIVAILLLITGNVWMQWRKR